MKNLIKPVLVAITLVINLQAVSLSDEAYQERVLIPVYFADSGIIAPEIKTAIYYSIDERGQVIAFENIDVSSFAEDYVLIQAMTGDEVYSHLTLYLENGKKDSFKVVGNQLVPTL